VEVKGAYIASKDGRLFWRAREALSALAGDFFADEDVVQVRNVDGVMFMMERIDDPGRDLYEGPFEMASGSEIPDMSAMTGCLIECRSENYFADLVGRISQTPGEQVYVVDGDGVIWLGDAIDPRRVRL
jgi:hypothetical protein